MAETAVKEKANGIPVPEEGTEEFARMNKMAKIAIPIVLIIFTMGVLQQQAFGMIYVNIGDQLGQANLAPLITSIPGIVLGIVCVIYGSLGDFVSLKKMMILGTIVFVLGSILGCFGDLSIWIVIAARTVQSAGWQVSGSIFLVLHVIEYLVQVHREEEASHLVRRVRRRVPYRRGSGRLPCRLHDPCRLAHPLWYRHHRGVLHPDPGQEPA